MPISITHTEVVEEMVLLFVCSFLWFLLLEFLVFV